MLNLKIRVAFVTAILTLLAMGAISYRARVSSNESEKWVSHTHEVLENLQGLLLAVETIESDYREFAMTGDESALGSYPTNILSARQHIAAIRQLTVDNSSQQPRIANIERLTVETIQFGEMVVGLRRMRGSDAVAAAIRNGQSQRIADELSAIISESQAEEVRLLKLRVADSQRRFGQTKTSIVAGTGLAVLIVVTAGWIVRQAEEDLRQSEERFGLFVSSVTDYAILMFDPEGRVISWNNGAQRVQGYRSEEIIGQHFSRFYLPEDVRNGEPDFNLTEAASNGQFECEGWRVRKDGSRFRADVVITAVRDKTGQLTGFGNIVRDITERKESEQNLKVAADLRRSNDQLQQFAYVASHDLQEPLRMVASFTQLLAKRYEGRLDADADEFITYAVDGCNRMQELIRGLLAYSRSGSDSPTLQEISSEHALNEALAGLRSTIDESGAIVTHDPLPAITVDGTQLIQVFQNLVGNAIKYRRGAVPKVHVSARKDAREWTFSVRDNGLGIAPQYFEKIFVLFQRLHGRNEFNGTGIGLAICKKIVEQSGGRIWVESQPDEGSSFHFSLPEREGK